MTINNRIHTTLTMKEVAVICAAFVHLQLLKDQGVGVPDKFLADGFPLAERLANELYFTSTEDHTKK